MRRMRTKNFMEMTFAIILVIMLVFTFASFQTKKVYSADTSGTDIVYNESEKSMSISWEAISTADKYDIYRAGSRLGDYQKLATVTSLSFKDESPNENRLENYYKIVGVEGEDIVGEKLISIELKLFGPNVKFYDAKYDDMDDIRSEINTIFTNGIDGYSGTKDAQFGSMRFSFYLKPGDYSGASGLNIGYYTHIGGLGKLPTDTRIGNIATPPTLANNNATCTFWRSVENLEVNGYFNWAVSQAAPARRINSLQSAAFDYGGWSSGGFVADSYFHNNAGSGTQQQFYVRNSHLEKTFNGVNWNKVIQGSTGLALETNWDRGGSVTTVEETPIIREKPFLFLDGDRYKVFVPALRENAVGVSWTFEDMGEGEVLDLEDDFYIARVDKDTSTSINEKLASGKNLFVTPGNYLVDEVIKVEKANTVVLGTGYATFIPNSQNNEGAMFVADEDNITIASIMFDTLYSSKYLLRVGTTESRVSHKNNPTLLADVIFRVGGITTNNVNVDVSLEVHSNNVIGDHFWVWRADHGSGVGWYKNTAKNGVIVTGKNVTFYGLFVEHYQEYQIIWLGNGGKTYFYQCELPYDPANQSVYMSHNGTVNGYAGYKVGNRVTSHYAVGMGIYDVFNRVGSGFVFVDNAIEVPNAPNVVIENACIVSLSNAGHGINSIVNGTGNGGIGGGAKRNYVVKYSDGVSINPSAKTVGISLPDEEFDLDEIDTTEDPDDEGDDDNNPAFDCTGTGTGCGTINNSGLGVGMLGLVLVGLVRRMRQVSGN